jgi:hypothetical protein
MLRQFHVLMVFISCLVSDVWCRAITPSNVDSYYVSFNPGNTNFQVISYPSKISVDQSQLPKTDSTEITPQGVSGSQSNAELNLRVLNEALLRDSAPSTPRNRAGVGIDQGKEPIVPSVQTEEQESQLLPDPAALSMYGAEDDTDSLLNFNIVDEIEQSDGRSPLKTSSITESIEGNLLSEGDFEEDADERASSLSDCDYKYDKSLGIKAAYTNLDLGEFTEDLQKFDARSSEWWFEKIKIHTGLVVDYRAALELALPDDFNRLQELQEKIKEEERQVAECMIEFTYVTSMMFCKNKGCEEGSFLWWRITAQKYYGLVKLYPEDLSYSKRLDEANAALLEFASDTTGEGEGDELEGSIVVKGQEDGVSEDAENLDPNLPSIAYITPIKPVRTENSRSVNSSLSRSSFKRSPRPEEVYNTISAALFSFGGHRSPLSPVRRERLNFLGFTEVRNAKKSQTRIVGVSPVKMVLSSRE